MTAPRWVTFIHGAARASAFLGGFILCLLVVVVVLSVAGRSAFHRPIPGAFEIVEIGTAIVVFLCLPWCQLNRGQLMVDFLLAGAPERVRVALDAAAAILASVLALLLAWRMTAGLADAVAYADISMILGIPLWWAYPFAVASLLLLAATSIVSLVRDLGRQPW